MIACDRRGPVFIAEYPADMTEAELRAHQAEWEGFYAANDKPFGWVMVLNGPGTSALRRMIVEHGKRNQRHFRTYLRCAALVHTGPVARHVLAAAVWLWEPVFPVRTFATRDDALAWARSFF